MNSSLFIASELQSLLNTFRDWKSFKFPSIRRVFERDQMITKVTNSFLLVSWWRLESSIISHGKIQITTISLVWPLSGGRIHYATATFFFLQFFTVINFFLYRFLLLKKCFSYSKNQFMTHCVPTIYY